MKQLLYYALIQHAALGSNCLFRKELELDLQGTPLMVIRIGYVNDYPEPVSLRRPVDSFTIFK